MRSVADVFKSLPVVNAVHRADTLPAAAGGYEHQTMTLGWEDRLRVRARRTTDAGAAFATALPRGTVLKAGDVLVVNALRLVVDVIELAEPVLVICPATPEDWGIIGYFIGNSHQPMMVAADGIVVPDLLGMSQVLDFHQVSFVRAERPFTPIGQVPSHRHTPGA
jgi:urease accessory protein UreE